MPMPKPPPAPPAKRRALSTRVLCLGNDLLADDAFGPVVARTLKELYLPGVEVVESPASGLHLLEHVLDAEQLIIVDAIDSGSAPPGTLYVLHPEQLPASWAVSPHYAGLGETLALARVLGLCVADQVTLLAVETADCRSVGGAMHPAVEESVRRATQIVCELVAEPSGAAAVPSGGDP